jgi:hypothetical protein
MSAVKSDWATRMLKKRCYSFPPEAPGYLWPTLPLKAKSLLCTKIEDHIRIQILPIWVGRIHALHSLAKELDFKTFSFL